MLERTTAAMGIIERNTLVIDALCSTYDADSTAFKAALLLRGLENNRPDGMVSKTPFLRFDASKWLLQLSEARARVARQRFLEREIAGKKAFFVKGFDGMLLKLGCAGAEGQLAEWCALERARAIDSKGAVLACSVGFWPISVEMWKDLGFSDPNDLFCDSYYDEGQLRQALLLLLRPGLVESGLKSARASYLLLANRLFELRFGRQPSPKEVEDYRVLLLHAAAAVSVGIYEEIGPLAIRKSDV